MAEDGMEFIELQQKADGGDFLCSLNICPRIRDSV
jgi:hypothetical protein